MAPNKQGGNVLLVGMVLGLLALVGIAHGQELQTQSVVALQDTYIWDAAADDNHGGAGSLMVGDPRQSAGAAPAASRVMLKFNIGALPTEGPAVTIVSARIELQVFQNHGGRAHTLSAHRLLREWGEGNKEAVDQGAAEGDATWNSARHGTDAWSVPGAGGDDDRSPTASGTASVEAGSDAVAISGSGLAADVQAWLDGTATNHGWLVVSDREAANPPSILDLDAVETGSTTPPKLVIEYTTVLPAPQPDPTDLCGSCGTMGIVTLTLTVMLIAVQKGRRHARRR